MRNLIGSRLLKNKICKPLQISELFDFAENLGKFSVLQSNNEVNAAKFLINAMGLPAAFDPKKSWDTLKCLYYLVKNTQVNSNILDAGSSSDSVILNWLSLLGYENLYACDLRPADKKRYSNKRINFSVQDLTNTNYPDNFFKVVTSISVIEHGVNLEKYIKEMSRIIQSGGFLLNSTDYWPEFIDCKGIYPYGKEMGEMKVFQRKDIENLCSLAGSCGFQPCSKADYNALEKVVRWERVNREFSFIFIPFKKGE